MALYKYSHNIEKSDDPAFDPFHQPGGKPQHSGIYRCGGCGREIVAEESRTFPPQNHHEHSPSQGAIRWRLVIYADHKPK
jgi:hypothetical protein